MCKKMICLAALVFVMSLASSAYAGAPYVKPGHEMTVDDISPASIYSVQDNGIIWDINTAGIDSNLFSNFGFDPAASSDPAIELIFDMGSSQTWGTFTWWNRATNGDLFALNVDVYSLGSDPCGTPVLVDMDMVTVFRTTQTDNDGIVRDDIALTPFTARYIKVVFDDGPQGGGSIQGSEIAFRQVGPEAYKAKIVSPNDVQQDVALDAELVWAAGLGAVSHDVYFGTDETAVTDATTSTTGIFQINQPGTTYDPCMVFNANYYWRIDEVNASNPGSPTKGDVWNFSTAVVVDWAIGHENSIFYTDFTLSHTLGAEWDGLDGLWGENTDAWGGHTQTYMIQQNSENVTPLTLSLSGLPLGEYVVALWNWYPHGGISGGGGDYLAEATVEGLAATSDGWNGGHDFTMVQVFLGDGSFIYDGNTYDVFTEPRFSVSDGTINVSLGNAYTNHSYLGFWASIEGLTITRVSDIVFLDPNATHPNPLDGGPKRMEVTELTWTPGYLVAFAGPNNGHDVYFGTDWDDVNDANNNWPVGTTVYKGNQDPNSYTLPFTAVWDETYYWRIDEVNEADVNSPWRGNIWDFTIGCPRGNLVPDENHDCLVDEKDFANLANEWLDERMWPIQP